MRHHRTISSAVISCLVAAALTSCGPRMREQPNIHAYDRRMPVMPANAVPTSGALMDIQTSQTAPPPPGPNDAANGKIFYGYYCLMCHGSIGDGNGPVGESYLPKPSNLTTAAIKSYSDVQLYTKMLHGVGHDPIMSQTVPPDQRWPILRYIKNLGQSTP